MNETPRTVTERLRAYLDEHAPTMPGGPRCAILAEVAGLEARARTPAPIVEPPAQKVLIESQGVTTTFFAGPGQTFTLTLPPIVEPPAPASVIPDGYELAPGWTLFAKLGHAVEFGPHHFGDEWFCTGIECGGGYVPAAFGRRDGWRGSCRSHAVELGAIRPWRAHFDDFVSGATTGWNDGEYDILEPVAEAETNACRECGAKTPYMFCLSCAEGQKGQDWNAVANAEPNDTNVCQCGHVIGRHAAGRPLRCYVEGCECRDFVAAKAEPPKPAEDIDWAAFVPTDEMPGNGDVYRATVDGDVFGSTHSTCAGGSVFRRREGMSGGKELLATSHPNIEPFDYVNWRLVRHADGRWADGANPSGWCKPGCGTEAESIHPLVRACSKWGGATCFRPARGPGEWRCFCTPFCRDRFIAAQKTEAEAASRDSALTPAPPLDLRDRLLRFVGAEDVRVPVMRVLEEFLNDLDADIEGCDADELSEIEHAMGCVRDIRTRITNILTGVPCDNRGVAMMPAPPERPKCRSCPHPAHLGSCTKRSGQTAYACGCTAQTPSDEEPSTAPGAREATPATAGPTAPGEAQQAAVGADLAASPGAPVVGFYDLVAIGERLRTQDNRITALPIFVVQQKRRTYGFDTDYCEDDNGIAWLFDHEEATGDERVNLEADYQNDGTEPEGWTRTAFLDTWEYVMPFLTEAAAQRYIDENKHNLKEPRIYAESGYRNGEWKAIREFLAGRFAEPARCDHTSPGPCVEPGGCERVREARALIARVGGEG